MYTFFFFFFFDTNCVGVEEGAGGVNEGDSREVRRSEEVSKVVVVVGW